MGYVIRKYLSKLQNEYTFEVGYWYPAQCTSDTTYWEFCVDSAYNTKLEAEFRLRYLNGAVLHENVRNS